MVTTSPSVSTADPTRTPLTNVPLTLCASRISVPSGDSIRNAWWRDASTSWMTMSLSVARPTVSAPAGFCNPPDRDGIRACIIFVARFATSGGLAALGGDIWVGGEACEDADGLPAGICRCGG